MTCSPWEPEAAAAPTFYRRANSNWTLDYTVPGGSSLDTDGTHLILSSSAFGTQVHRLDVGRSQLIASIPFTGRVSLDGDRLAIARSDPFGSGLFNEVRIYAGIARGALQEVQVLSPPSWVEQFGVSVDLQGDVLVVGAKSRDPRGHALVYYEAGGSWRLTRQLVPLDPDAAEEFGSAVAVDGDRVLVGAPRTATAGHTNAGSVTSFRLARPPLSYCSGKTNSLGCVPFLTTVGTPSASGTARFTVAAQDGVPGEPARLLYSLASDDLDFHGGRLCIKAPFRTTGVPTAASPSGPPPCAGRWYLDFNARIRSGADPQLTAGQTVYAQWQQRDGADPAGFGDSYSAGLSFAVCP